MQIEIHPQKAIEYLLQQEYFNEFEVIDGINQHPEGMNFYDWLYKKGFIPKEHLKNLNDSIKDMED